MIAEYAGPPAAAEFAHPARQRIVIAGEIDPDAALRSEGDAALVQLEREAAAAHIIQEVADAEVDEISAPLFKKMRRRHAARLEIVDHDDIGIDAGHPAPDQDERQFQRVQHRSGLRIVGGTDQKAVGSAAGKHLELARFMVRIVVAPGRNDLDAAPPPGQLDRIQQPGEERVVDIGHQHPGAPGPGRSKLSRGDIEPLAGTAQQPRRLELVDDALCGDQRDAELVADFPHGHKGAAGVAVFPAADLIGDPPDDRLTFLC